jgi:hypothetical protein
MRTDLLLVRSDMPRQLARVIERAVNRRPEERYQTS